MRSPSLERLYAQINKLILLAQSHTEVNELTFIIKACRLKPYDFVFNNRNTKLVLHRQWVDEYGNTLNIVKNKRIKIVYNNLAINRQDIICTDLYFGLSIDRVAKMSKLVFLCALKEEETLVTQFFVALLGLDNYLRVYACIDGAWSQVSPLCLGMKALKTIARNTDIRYFREFSNKENAPLPCVSAREWISFMPPSAEFLQILGKEYDQSLSFLNVTKGTNTTHG